MNITKEVIQKHGLTIEEFVKIKDLLQREPNILELGIFSAMWNEHCSYKSSKIHLKKLPTKNKNVIQGPGENAGIIDIGDGDAIVFKIESHNHPSFIEPYQGAATGVGGILRDVFTMGARPIALLNSIHFGSPENTKTRNLLHGVVSGIGGYGNCIGIPIVAGETKFNQTYNENILVNAMAVGLVKKNKIFYSKAKGIGKSVVYVGSKTGRDGIHGASMASAEFDDDSEEKKPTVQVGDPFTEKLLMEACLELMKDKSITIKGSTAIILGITYKENCNDIRNSKVHDIFHSLKSYGINVDIHDPLANPEEVYKEYNIRLKKNPAKYEAIILAVPHNLFLEKGLNDFKSPEASVVYDVKAALKNEETEPFKVFLDFICYYSPLVIACTR